MLEDLTRPERLALMKFVCSFAWADLEIRPEEREFIAGLIRRLELEEDERTRVEGWLEVPPSPEAVDPTRIPVAHRKIFLEEIEGVIQADGEVSPEERENLGLLNDLLA